jgi:PKD repeat protein
MLNQINQLIMNKSVLLIAVAIVSSFLVGCIKEPNACFTASSESLDDDNNPVVGEKITFENCSQDADSYNWDFGDGETSTEKNPKYTYSEGGEYTVTLEATNKKGTTTSEFDIEVLSLTGGWEGSMDIDGEIYNILFEIEQKSTKLEGVFSFDDGSGTADLVSSEIADNVVAIIFELDFGDGDIYEFEFDGEVNSEYDSMSGVYYVEGIELGEWSAEKTSSKSVKIEQNLKNPGKSDLLNALKNKLR